MSCEYCAGIIDDRPSLIGIDGHEVYIDGYGKLTLEHPSGWCSDREIAFCPVCGSPLSDPAPLTLEALGSMTDNDFVWLDFPELDKSESGWHRARRTYQIYSHEHYGKTWLVYTHKPKDREGER